MILHLIPKVYCILNMMSDNLKLKYNYYKRISVDIKIDKLNYWDKSKSISLEKNITLSNWELYNKI